MSSVGLRPSVGFAPRIRSVDGDPSTLHQSGSDGSDRFPGDYWWVESGACDTAWQVPYLAESVR